MAGDGAMASLAAENIAEHQVPREGALKSGPDVNSDEQFAAMVNAAAFEPMTTHR